jgi:hypothetical protein
LPEFIDESDITPEGVTPINNGEAQVDVFYIHGTTYSNTHSWPSPYTYNATTENNARFALAASSKAYLFQFLTGYAIVVMVFHYIYLILT